MVNRDRIEPTFSGSDWFNFLKSGSSSVSVSYVLWFNSNYDWWQFISIPVQWICHYVSVISLQLFENQIESSIEKFILSTPNSFLLPFSMLQGTIVFWFTNKYYKTALCSHWHKTTLDVIVLLQPHVFFNLPFTTILI